MISRPALSRSQSGMEAAAEIKASICRRFPAAVPEGNSSSPFCRKRKNFMVGSALARFSHQIS